MNNSINPVPQPTFRIGDQIRVLTSGELATVKALTGHSVVATIEGLEDNLVFNRTEVEAAVRALLCSICNATIGTISVPLPDVPVKCSQCSRAESCALFCNLGTGHLDEMFAADRVCWGPDHLIPLTLERQTHAENIPACEVSARRQWGGPDSVYVCALGGDMDLTPVEARQLAGLLLQVAEQVENEGVRP
ncbi:hypothetical protein K8O92_10025 [Nocardia asteroides]|nr:hypothetical protein K8O92_10025 [Nocardia asteroides]